MKILVGFIGGSVSMYFGGVVGLCCFIGGVVAAVIAFELGSDL